jgi:hypothetical protein
MEKQNWPELTALASQFLVEPPGIETDSLPGILASERPVRSISVPFSPTRYLRIRSRVLTASRAVTYRRTDHRRRSHVMHRSQCSAVGTEPVIGHAEPTLPVCV